MSTLHARTHFSLGQSILSPKAIVEQAKANGYTAVAICDKHSLCAMTDIIAECNKANIDYYVGATLPLHTDAGEKVKTRLNYELKAFVKNEDGLKSLFKLLSKAFSSDRFYYVPRLFLSDLTKESLEGLLITTGDLNSIFAYTDWEKDIKLIQSHSETFALEFCKVDQPYFERINTMAAKFSLHCGPLVNKITTRPVLYLEDQADYRDLAQAVSNNSDPNHFLAPKPFTRDFHVVPVIEEITTDVLKTYCRYKWVKKEMNLPTFAKDEFAELVKLCKIGWSERLHAPVFGETLDKDRLDEYKNRLATELGVIKKMGFSAYFLLVRYVVNWSKDNEILVGPARGSAAGSLVAYLLKITDVDPLRFGLIFERFLNPDRQDYPDIDLDFMSSRRNEIINHIIDKFGVENVSGIANYNTLGSASALRDVGRVSGLPIQDYECSKLIPKEHGQNVSLEEAVLEVTEIENYALKYPSQFKASCALQGVVRSMAQHAAGIVVAGSPLVESGVVATNKEIPVVCWDKQIVEDWGLIKLDVLGLSTLDIIKIALDTIHADGTKLNLWEIPLDDKSTLEVFAKGRTKGVFQFEGGAARSLCRDVAVSGDFHFNDIVAINALNRPGPLDAGLTAKYVKIRQGVFSPSYPHPLTESALEETQGVMVYQEQIMQISRDLAGFSMAEADNLRKAIGKKDAVKMKTMKVQFIEGAVRNGMFESDASMLWDDIEGFAAYSFNKSHAVAYSLISYMAAYLKANYAGAFYAASMTVLDDDKVKLIAREATSDGFIVMPPDINKSTDRFEIVHDHSRDCKLLYSPLTAVKNVSSKVCQHIMEVRQTKTAGFESYADFFASVEARKCNVRAKNNLTAVGAFASLEKEQLHALHNDRLRDQKELMGALAVSDVKPDRVMDISPFLISELAKLYDEIASNSRQVVNYTSGSKPKFVVITDKPSYFEIQEGCSFKGKSDKYIREALKESGLKPSQGYYTHLVKTEPEGKELTREEIAYYGDYLKKELDLINPPLVILAGTKSIRYFFPDVKGSAEELSGTIEFNKEQDRSYMMCINPQMIYIKPNKQELLTQVFKDVAELLDVA